MTISAVRMSATIYQFPPRGRVATSSARLDDRKIAESLPRPASSYGSAWYHEAAIQEDRPRKA
jgi:hypothetical protein